jgi:chromosomal replication initiator protein
MTPQEMKLELMAIGYRMATANQLSDYDVFVDLRKKSSMPLMPKQIIDMICEHYGVIQDDVFSESRRMKLRLIRQIIQYLIYEFTGLSTGEVGCLTSRNHATVLHSCRVVRDGMKYDKLFENEMYYLISLLKIN